MPLFRRVFFVFFAILCSAAPVFFSAPLFAGGTHDPVLSRADELVKEKRYNEALNLLTEFIRRDDIRFDPAQERIRKILRIFDKYDKLVDVLMTVVEEDPEAEEKIVSIANELRRIDAAHDEETRRFVNRIQEVARFTINRKLIEAILREGRELIDKKDYIAALRKYREGFGIFDYELRDSGFRANILNESRDKLNALDRAITSAQGAQDSLQNSTRSLNAQNLQAIPAIINTLSPSLDTLTNIKAEIADAHNFFEKTGNLPEIDESGVTGRLYYPAAALFLRGRSSDDIREGMLGAIDGIWRNAVDPLNLAFGDAAERLYQEALVPTEKANYPLARTNITAARNFLKPLDTVVQKTDKFTSYDEDFTMPKKSLRIEDSVLRFRTMDNALGHFDAAQSIGTRLGALENRSKALNFNDLAQNATAPEKFFAELSAIQTGMSALNGEVATGLNVINRENNALLSVAKIAAVSGADVKTKEREVDAALRYSEDSRRITEAFVKVIASGELANANKIYPATNSKLKNELDALTARHAEGERLLTGIPLRTEQGAEIEAKYSREASEIFDSLTGTIALNLDIGERALNTYSADAGRAEISNQLKPYNTETEDYVRRLRELQAKDSNALATARERYARSERLRIDGDRLFAESKRSLSAENFDLARERLENATGRFVESLGLQENPALRRRWGSDLEPLAAEIARLEYEFIVREVRGLIDTSRERYYAGTFDRAEESLVRAEGRWAKVNTEPNDELVYWLGLVRGALSLRAGANVPVTAPLYPEVSQLLSAAKKNYSEGLSLIEARRESGMIKFAEAKEKTQEIKLMFPVNQEAGILELKIEQIIDPSAFETAFRRRFVTAVAGTKRGEREPYFELENLAKINPDYPGMQAALLEAKYDVGILRRPVDNAAQTEAASYLAQARRLFSQGAQTAEVMRLSQAALRLDPNNRQATALLDQARLRGAQETSRASVIVSDSNAEQEYLLAVTEFQQGRALNALARIQRLLRNPANKNNQRFNELLRRVTAVVQ